MSDWTLAGHDGWCSVRLTPEQFEFKVNRRAEIEFDNFHDAASYTAKLLAAKYNDKPLYVSLSGGLDSEVIANTFVKEGIPFTPIILNIGNVIEHETWYAEYWCKQHNITPVRINVTLDEYVDIVKRYTKILKNTHQIGTIGYMYVAECVYNLGGYYVGGVGDINQDGDRFFSNSVDFALDMWKPGQAPTGFFMYTPEIALAYIKQFDPTVTEQYNKLSFYGVSPRPKYNWVAYVYGRNKRLDTIYDIWYKYVPNSQAHWYGTKQQVINILKPK